MKWELLTTEELSKYSKKEPVILGLSAIEQHGPHLPMATDRMIIDHFIDRLNELYRDKVLTLPSIAVGCSSHHLDFTGSLTLSHDTFTSVVMETIDSAYRHGFRNFLLLNSHGGNVGVGQVILEKLGHRYLDAQFTFTSWWRLAAPELLDLTESKEGGVGHACEFETSLIQWIDPKSVRPCIPQDRANRPTYSWSEGDMLRGSRATYYRTIKKMCENGVYGDPWLASAEKGKKISDLVLEQLKLVLKEMI